MGKTQLNSVRTENKLVNVVSFLGMSQDSEDTAGSFAARFSDQGAGHGRRLTRETSEVKCRAFKAICRKCSKPGHFEACCQSRREENTQHHNLGDTQEVGSFCQLSMVSSERYRSGLMIYPGLLLLVRCFVSCNQTCQPWSGAGAVLGLVYMFQRCGKGV